MTTTTDIKETKTVKPKNHGKRWTVENDSTFDKMVDEKESLDNIAAALYRTENGIIGHACVLIERAANKGLKIDDLLTKYSFVSQKDYNKYLEAKAKDGHLKETKAKIEAYKGDKLVTQVNEIHTMLSKLMKHLGVK